MKSHLVSIALVGISLLIVLFGGVMACLNPSDTPPNFYQGGYYQFKSVSWGYWRIGSNPIMLYASMPYNQPDRVLPVGRSVQIGPIEIDHWRGPAK